jgi:hypothetical protein
MSPLVLLTVPLAWVAYRWAKASEAPSGGPKLGNPIPVTGPSGQKWTMQLVKLFDTPQGKQTFWDVFIGNARILRYSQTGELKGSRKFIGTPLAKGDARLARAAADFGVMVPAQQDGFGNPETSMAGDIKIERFGDGTARITSPRGSAIAGGSPPQIIRLLSGTAAGVMSDLRSLG